MVVLRLAGTILQQDSLDLLAHFMGKGEQVENLTNQAMDGTMNLATVCLSLALSTAQRNPSIRHAN